MLYERPRYHATAVKAAPPVPAFRSKSLDWQELTLTEQIAVERFHRGECEVRDLPVRGQVFIRRYYDGV